jgi:hypothetical protein
MFRLDDRELSERLGFARLVADRLLEWVITSDMAAFIQGGNNPQPAEALAVLNWC